MTAHMGLFSQIFWGLVAAMGIGLAVSELIAAWKRK